MIAKAGGEDWWTALSGRVKAQNLLAAYQDNQLVRQGRQTHGTYDLHSGEGIEILLKQYAVQCYTCLGIILNEYSSLTQFTGSGDEGFLQLLPMLKYQDSLGEVRVHW